MAASMDGNIHARINPELSSVPAASSSRVDEPVQLFSGKIPLAKVETTTSRARIPGKWVRVNVHNDSEGDGYFGGQVYVKKSDLQNAQKKLQSIKAKKEALQTLIQGSGDRFEGAAVHEVKATVDDLAKFFGVDTDFLGNADLPEMMDKIGRFDGENAEHYLGHARDMLRNLDALEENIGDSVPEAGKEFVTERISKLRRKANIIIHAIEPVSVQSLSQAKVDSGYFTNYSQHNEGNVDSLLDLRSVGVVGVQDYEGHNKPKRAHGVQQTTQAFCDTFRVGYSNVVKGSRTKEAFRSNIENFIKSAANKAPAQTEDNIPLGKGSLTGLVKLEGKQFVWAYQGGDAPIFLRKKSGETRELEFPYSNALNKGTCQLVEVEEGDQVFTLSDGFECPTKDKQDQIDKILDADRQSFMGVFLADMKKRVGEGEIPKEAFTAELQSAAQFQNYTLSQDEIDVAWDDFSRGNFEEKQSKVGSGEEKGALKQTSEDLTQTISETDGNPGDVIEALRNKLVVLDEAEYQGRGPTGDFTDDCSAMGFTVP